MDNIVFWLLVGLAFLAFGPIPFIVGLCILAYLVIDFIRFEKETRNEPTLN